MSYFYSISNINHENLPESIQRFMAFPNRQNKRSHWTFPTLSINEHLETIHAKIAGKPYIAKKLKPAKAAVRNWLTFHDQKVENLKFQYESVKLKSILAENVEIVLHPMGTVLYKRFTIQGENSRTFLYNYGSSYAALAFKTTAKPVKTRVMVSHLGHGQDLSGMVELIALQETNLIHAIDGFMVEFVFAHGGGSKGKGKTRDVSLYYSKERSGWFVWDVQGLFGDTWYSLHHHFVYCPTLQCSKRYKEKASKAKAKVPKVKVPKVKTECDGIVHILPKKHKKELSIPRERTPRLKKQVFYGK